MQNMIEESEKRSSRTIHVYLLKVYTHLMKKNIFFYFFADLIHVHEQYLDE